MKPFISNQTSALTYLLEDMYDAEKKIQKYLPGFARLVSSRDLKRELRKYCESASDKRLKLKRVFGYLLAGRFDKENGAMNELLNEIKAMSKLTVPSVLGDRMIIVRLQEINQCKLAVYRTALVLADQLNLATVTGLLEEVLGWETETNQMLSRISMQLLVKKKTPATLQD